MDFQQLTSDFAQRYLNTYVWLQQRNEPEELVVIQKVDGDSDEGFPLVQFHSDELGTNSVRYDTDCVFKFKRPPVGVFQYGKHALLISRTEKQQYSKGVSSHTYQIRPVFHRYISKANMLSGNGWSRALKASYSPKFYSWNTAIGKLNAKEASSVALSSRFSLVQGLDKKAFNLYHYHYIIGKVDVDGNCDFEAARIGGSKLTKIINSR